MNGQPTGPADKLPSPMVLRYFLILFLISILTLARLFWPFLSILILSFLLAGLFRPIFAFLDRKLASSAVASLLTCILIVVLVFVPLMVFVGALSKEAFDLYQLGKGANLGLKLKDFIQESTVLGRLREVLSGLGLRLDPQSLSDALSGLAKIIGFFLYNQASTWAANIMHFLFNFFMMVLVIFFLLIDHDRFIAFILRLSPLPDSQERQLINKFEQISGAVLVGNGICGLIQGALGGLAFAILGAGSPILWGGVMVVLAFLPIFGIGLVMVPAAFLLFIKGSSGGAIALLVIYILISFSMEYLLKPKMVGEQVKMHTLLVFLSIVGGLSVFGVIGIVYGPLIVTAFLTMAEIYLQNYDGYVKGDKSLPKP